LRASLIAAPDFRLLFESAPGLYLVLEPDLTIVAASDAYLRATMTRREQVVGRGLFEVFPDNPDDPTATGVGNLRASLARVLARREPDAMAVQQYDIRRPDADGGGFERRHWSPVNAPVFGPDGDVAYIIHRVEDVTEFLRLKQLGQREHETIEELRTRTGAMEVEIYRRAQEIQEVNQQLRAWHVDLEVRVQVRTSELQQANDDLQREVGERRKAEVALQRSEEQLRQTQKLEAVGRLAGGVAHDFNNLLSVILGYSSLLLGKLDATSPVRPDLEEIQRAAQSAALLTRQMLAFSRQQVLDPAILSMHDVLTDVNSMLTRILGEDIELRMLLRKDLGLVKADRGQLEQVLMNLVVNARDAMPNGGKLTIEAANVNLDEAYATEFLGITPGPYVLLAVSDTGVGMDKETQARAFEPFFTTKEQGRGTGLGLSTVFGIVKQSGGGIWLYSEPGEGTTFKIFFPAVSNGAVSERATSSAQPSGTETVLIVEDDDSVRHVVTNILGQAGYQVIDARSPGEALLTCQQPHPHIDLLLTDTVMPKMSGRELAGRIGHLRPSIKVLFMSGYTDDVILHHGVLDAGVAFVQKPLTVAALTQKVRQVLDGDTAGT
jgi:signal transduction histidine kinase/ActR/RegA family two-component response regulator